MGLKSHTVEKLGAPFVFAEEMVFYLPPGGQLTIEKDQFKLLFILKGEALHELEPLGPPRPIRAGDIIVCPSFRFHRYINPEPEKTGQLHTMRLVLDTRAINNSGKKRVRRPEFNLVDFVHHNFNRTIQCESGIDSHITGILSALRRETEERSRGYRHYAHSLCTELVVAVARKLEAVEHNPQLSNKRSAHYVVASAKEYIMKNLQQPLTLGQIAWHTGKGEEHLARLFKRDTGQSVFDFVREARINQAKTYLLDSSLSLSKVAGLCGFSSLSFFSRTFRNIVGIPPSQYRQHMETSLSQGPLPVSKRNKLVGSHHL